jgi:succinate-semialdehyde dehydrogenase/glutarate-semialdehyde dehydrogenase
MAVIAGLLSIPLTFIMTNAAFYFGVLPILSETAGHFGVEPSRWPAPPWSASPCTGPAPSSHPSCCSSAAAVESQKAWRLVPVEDRVQVLRNTAQVLREGKAEYARLITLEMGKPISEAEAEIEKCALTAEYYAGTAPAHLAPENIASSAADSGVVFDPLGVVLAIMPWN